MDTVKVAQQVEHFQIPSVYQSAEEAKEIVLHKGRASFDLDQANPAVNHNLTYQSGLLLRV